ncbi:hypothetical protein GUJ93_ZPchr0013g34605 [Zizania palustris]|uniref:Secreted protein n=1 Tax=Zizania palustris TaxID=103762 RepID=A0A8J5WSI9_ZIZPA|nr:hypothetical protein GUJ93_ZPchr0013g34605 [Zizania palustris]
MCHWQLVLPASAIPTLLATAIDPTCTGHCLHRPALLVTVVDPANPRHRQALLGCIAQCPQAGNGEQNKRKKGEEREGRTK